MKSAALSVAGTPASRRLASCVSPMQRTLRLTAFATNTWDAAPATSRSYEKHHPTGAMELVAHPTRQPGH